jgi:2-dehydro-3-deoxygluconokinase
MLSVVADNELGQAAIAELRKHGVQTQFVRQDAGRMGLYFLTHGAVSRPSTVLYDRADSAFARADADALDVEAALQGATWLHISGITPAVGAKAAKAACALVEAAVAHGVQVSFDGNYRAQLWANWGGDGPSILRNLLSHASLAFINERDLALILGEDFPSKEVAYQKAFEVFPRLQWIAATTRGMDSVTQQSLSGHLVSRTGQWSSRVHRMEQVVDRIGAGDGFAAGVLHGLIQAMTPQNCIEFATASGVIKHSIAGDFNLTNVAEVADLAAGGGLDVKR